MIMGLKFYVDLITSTQKTVNSNKLNKYNFLGLNIEYCLLYYLLMFINTIINQTDGKEFSLAINAFQAGVLFLLSYGLVYCQVAVIYLLNRVSNGKYIKLSTVFKTLIPFWGIFLAIKMIVALLLQAFNLYGSGLNFMLETACHVWKCYPAYLLFVNNGFSKRRIWCTLSIYILLSFVII